MSHILYLPRPKNHAPLNNTLKKTLRLRRYPVRVYPVYRIEKVMNRRMRRIHDNIFFAASTMVYRINSAGGMAVISTMTISGQ
jgi:hypothetical protein